MTWKERQHSFSLADKDKASLTGNVFDIQRFSVHDGGGIRTLVFLKGCPLQCQWCQNPESMKQMPQIMRHAHLCIGCGKCVSLCPEKAIAVGEDGELSILRDKCTLCGKCVEHCYAGSMVIVGRYLTVEEVMDEVERDRAFYIASQGGVTFSGGEPTMQHEFLIACLKEAKQRQLHTAIETCAYTAPAIFSAVQEHTDLILTDIKHMDSARHKQLTGMGNDLILRNIADAARNGAKLRIRIPLIPGRNDSEENIQATAQFVSKLGDAVQALDILPYHRLGEPKWEQLGRPYPLQGVPPLDKGVVYSMQAIAKDYIPVVTIGGNE